MATEISSRGMTKFNGSNFLVWKFQMKSLLLSKGILDIVTGARTLLLTDNEEDRQRWIQDDATASFLISSAMEPEQVQPLLICDTSKQMWDSLKAIYEQSSESSRLLRTQKFHSYRMVPTDTVIQHISKVQNMAKQLLEIGENVSNTTIIAKILGSLGPKFNSFRSAWDSVQPKRQTLNYLQERLLEEEARFLEQEEVPQAHVAWRQPEKKTMPRKFSKKPKKNNNNGNNGQRPAQPKGVCFVCGKSGHYARDCSERKGQKQHRPQQQHSDEAGTSNFQSFVAMVKECAVVESSTHNCQFQSDSVEDTWIFDSGASAHITYNKNYMSEYRPLQNDTVIYLGDNVVCKVLGVGSVVIERFVNKQWIESKLDDVSLVPDMKKNLFPAGTFTSKELTVSILKNGVNILKNNQVLISGEKLQNNLYRLFIRVKQRSEDLCASVASLSTWHERLGHVNIRALKYLVSKNLVEGLNVQEGTNQSAGATKII